jgi:hypothetical protein
MNKSKLCSTCHNSSSVIWYQHSLISSYNYPFTRLRKYTINSSCYVPSKLAQVVMSLTCIWEVAWILVRTLTILRLFEDFLLQANAGIISQTRPQLLLFTSFQNHSIIINEWIKTCGTYTFSPIFITLQIQCACLQNVT